MSGVKKKIRRKEKMMSTFDVWLTRIVYPRLGYLFFSF
jgi:hypothetical protein